MAEKFSLDELAKKYFGSEDDLVEEPDIQYWHAIKFSIIALSKSPAATEQLLFALDDAYDELNKLDQKIQSGEYFTATHEDETRSQLDDAVVAKQK